MRLYFLILLFGLIPFLSPAQVLIKPETSQFFLEVHDSLQVYKRIDQQQDAVIQNLRESLNTKDAIIKTYKIDSQLRENLLTNKDKEIKNNQKEIRRQRRLKWLGYIIAVGVTVLSVTN